MINISQRRQIVEQYAKMIRERYPQTDKYNILVFGSFLTERYKEKSDIDIGVFSLVPGLTFRLYSYTKDYFEQLGITDYCPPELINYIKMMVEQYGENHQEKAIMQMNRQIVR